MKTYTATPADIRHDWHVVDATGVPLGRLASAVAQLIRGKHKPTFTPHKYGGDFVIVLNAGKAVFGMLPKNSLSKQRLRLKLKVYAGAEHPHEAQQAKPYVVKVNAKVNA